MDLNGFIGNVGASTAGTLASKLTLYPLDTIAVQYQTSTRRPLFSVPLKSYYRGIGVAIVMTVPATALYLTSREVASTALLPRLGNGSLNDALSGCIAEVVGSVLFTPMEVLKARLQISLTATEGTFLYQARSIAQNEGLKGFYRGYTMGLAMYLPYNIIWWTTYGNIIRNMKERSQGTQIACGAAAAALAGTVFIHPLELLKTRYQVATSDAVAAASSVTASRASDREGLRQVVKNIKMESGMKGFYIGFLPTLLRSVPSSVIMMTVYELSKPERKDMTMTEF